MEPSSVSEHLQATYHSLVTSVFNSLPKLLVGLVMVALAVLVAKIAERAIRIVLARLRFDSLLERMGLDKTLRKFGLQQPPSQLIPRLCYFLLLFLFAQTAAQALGLVPISNAIGSFFGFLPNLISALLLVLIGSTAGQFAGATVGRAAREAGIDFASTLGNIVSVLILFVAGIMAIAQLKIDTEIIRIVTGCTLAGVAIAFGLSFGLGTRDITRNIVAGFYARKIMQAGDPIEIRGEKGVLKAITPVQTLVERDQQTVVIANSIFLDEMVKR